MPHINPQGVDMCVAAFIVHQPTQEFFGRVLLIDHVKLGKWLAVGGHVEAHQTLDDALYAEVEEEVGLLKHQLTWLQPSGGLSLPHFATPENHNQRQLIQPVAIDLHDFPPLPGHRHQAAVYFGVSETDVIPPTAEYYNSHRWYEHDELLLDSLNTTQPIRWYARRALERARDWAQYNRGCRFSL